MLAIGILQDAFRIHQTTGVVRFTPIIQGTTKQMGRFWWTIIPMTS